MELPLRGLGSSSILEASLANLIRSVKEQGLEGLVAKRRDSKYEPGERSGAWAKMRVNRAQEFVIGGYTLRGRHFDALIFGYWEAVAPAVPATEDAGVSVREPARGAGGALGDGLTAAKMKDCRWLRPVPMGQFEFVEWTQKKHLGIRGLRLGDKWGIRDKVNAIPG